MLVPILAILLKGGGGGNNLSSQSQEGQLWAQKGVGYGDKEGGGLVSKMQIDNSTTKPVGSWRWPCWALI